MSLFKKKENNACSCNSNTQDNKITEDKKDTACCNGTEKGICCIKVLGSGCKSCHTLLENTKYAVSSMKLDSDVEYVTDMQKIMEYGVMSMPALVVNEKVVAMGKVLKSDEVEKLLHKFIS